MGNPCLCYLCITVLNLFTMQKVIRKSPNVPKHLLKPFIASLIMGGVAYGMWRLTAAVTGSRLVQCTLPIAVAASCICDFWSLPCALLPMTTACSCQRGRKLQS